MSANSRLTLAVHTLTWMAQYRDEYEFATSERIARSVQTNPVVLRGLLGMMEKQHLVNVQRGSNAGWQLARNPAEITLLDVYHAVEQPTLFAMHHTQPNPRCIIGCGIGPALGDIYANAQSALEQELARTTIADLLRATLACSAAIRRQVNAAQTAPPLESSQT
ncbi:MAG TPA: Rrf2 family transcriptional regulator [Ktedonobacteraceae bacterium]|jgi:Rrf2 family protein